MRPALARTIWHHVEAINAVAYFSPESADAAAGLGLKGFWMGYFGFRAAPLGPVGSAVVEATFFNFHPDRVRRAIPDAWRYASPGEILTVRSAAAAASVRRILTEPDAERLAADALPPLRDVVGHASSCGRPLFAANREVEAPPDPVAALWQVATALREHRGDGHVASLTCADLDGCEAHALFAACATIPPHTFWQSRGWTTDDWERAVERLTSRGLLARDGAPTASGSELHEQIEARTDELALTAYESIGTDRCRQLLGSLEPVARRLMAEMPFPNPIGLPTPDEADGGDERSL
jgi:hypothetical protein